MGTAARTARSTSGGQGLHLGDQRPRCGDEIAAVPKIAVLDVAGGRRHVGLFDKGLDRRQAAAGGFDIAIGVGGAGRANAEGDDAPVACAVNGLDQGGPEGGMIGNMVIGGHKGRDAVRIQRVDPDGRRGHGCGRAPPFGLQKNPGRHTEFVQLFGDPVPVGDACDHNQFAAGLHKRHNPGNRVLKQRAATRQGQELFRPGRPGSRP
ncbi:MAG: hypothetical protein KKA45_11290 [Alphaproteobacteria bacterium]|nr:hypothetical protein [Alphaproteobacteria bacterium]